MIMSGCWYEFPKRKFRHVGTKSKCVNFVGDIGGIFGEAL